MPCSCGPACGCGSAGACAGSACLGAVVAAASIAAARNSVLLYHGSRMTALGRRVEEASPEEYEASHAEFVARKQAKLRHLQDRLKKRRSLRPIPVFRSGNRLRHEVASLRGRIERLTHEVSALEA